MKKLLFVAILAAAIVAGNSLRAQDTNQSAGSRLLSDAKAFFTDAQPFFTNATFEAGVLKNRDKYGGFADVQVPIANQASIGFGGAFLDGDFYDASISFRTGTTWKVPLLGDVYQYIGSGPGWNFQKQHAILYTFTGAIWKHDFAKFTLSAGGAIGSISDRAGPVIAAGMSGSLKFGSGSGFLGLFGSK